MAAPKPGTGGAASGGGAATALGPRTSTGGGGRALSEPGPASQLLLKCLLFPFIRKIIRLEVKGGCADIFIS